MSNAEAGSPLSPKNIPDLLVIKRMCCWSLKSILHILYCISILDCLLLTECWFRQLVIKHFEKFGIFVIFNILQVALQILVLLPSLIIVYIL